MVGKQVSYHCTRWRKTGANVSAISWPFSVDDVSLCKYLSFALENCTC